MKQHISKFFAALSLTMAVAMPAVAHAASNVVVVAPGNTQGWSSVAPLGDTRANGQVNFVDDSTSPFPTGALELKTGNAGASTDKAQYMHAANQPFSSITNLAYDTKQVSVSFVAGLPSYQLPTCLYGVTAIGCAASPSGSGATFATFVYEPYVNVGNDGVKSNTWQHWDVSGGKFWSSKDAGQVQASQGTYTYTLAQLKGYFPSAVLVSYGVNVGSNNPNYDVYTDGFVFNDTTYNFEKTEPKTTPTTKDQCKNDGYKNYVDGQGKPFRNQGQCVSYVEAHKTTVDGGIQYFAYSTVRRSAEFQLDSANGGGNFRYSDANKESYKVQVSSMLVKGNDVWFAGVVSNASNPANNGKWLFAKVEDGKPDKIWGSFTDQATAQAGVKAMTDPADGPFSVDRGALVIHTRND